jgi:hypothetical protein
MIAVMAAAFAWLRVPARSYVKRAMQNLSANAIADCEYVPEVKWNR